MYKKILKYPYTIIKNHLNKVSPIYATKFVYTINTKSFLNLKNPTNFNEKIQWLKLYWQHPLVVQAADKYAVREYIEKKDCGEILNELYGVYDNANEIDWEELPQAFALKTNNACGTMFVTKNKNELDELLVKNQLDKWLKEDFGKVSIEPHYSKMLPKIICERYLEDNTGTFPTDYKIFCFNGIPKFVNVITDRDGNNQYERHFLDLDWQPLNFSKDSSKSTPVKPRTFGKMVEYARILSKDFPFVRVDLYDIDGKIVFGELTFTPVAGMATYYTKEASEYLGSLIDLPPKYIGD
ncbi:ATP-grasp fold amidoligase family protein [Vagococcus humatus]|uniref:Uncharacterized protein n=1 Tax=Vagococcus humatus TaxID=1889241 RepID=A0A3S0ACZ0_9ENTE|nr:ATP-grasp fold amidoligase family protein [Vagococcus humatus]RST89912.1 hypothetical protein C7P63_02205 [Vagococcus humatus]